MRTSRLALGLSGGALIALAVALSPAMGASNDSRIARPRLTLSGPGSLGSFTPATTDPRLAAILSRSGLATSGFRFTPATSLRLNRSVTVAVRARTTGLAAIGDERTALVSPEPANIAPIAYNLGAAVGWRRFALSGDIAKVDLGALGGRESADVGVSYNTRKWSGRVAVGGDRPIAGAPRALTPGAGYSLDLGGSYRLGRNLDLTAGVRYRAAERDRLEPLADNRRDSQAVYIGTAFKF